jgi:serine/threonine protein kinase
LWSLGITALELAYGYAPYAKYPPMKVLVKTIQEDPPGFETYENEGFGDDDEWLNPKIEDWSQSFRDMVSWCLQKDPKKRPSCHELLSHAHFKPLNDKTVCLQYKERLVKEVLDKIPNVGAEDGDVTSKTTNDLDKSDIPVTIVTETDNNDDTRRVGTAWVFPEVSSEKRPSGTTWIFSDGSNVCVSAAEALGEKDDKEDLNAKSDFFDQFEKETQGEHFKHPSRQNSTSVIEPVTEKSKDDPDTNEEDDLNAFMDQFEKETGGEDFRKNKL